MDCMNPYIERFLRKLIAENEGELEPDAVESLVEGLNRLLENMLGRNMIAALPEELRKDFVSQYDKGSREVDVNAMSRLFDGHIDDPTRIMKSTLREFTDLYFRNRQKKRGATVIGPDCPSGL